MSMVLRSAVILEYWKRKEKNVALEWGMVDFERCETKPGFAPSRDPASLRLSCYAFCLSPVLPGRKEGSKIPIDNS